MKRRILAILIICLGVASFAHAAALDNTHMGAKANAMAHAFTGLADDPSAVFYNPAGLVFQREGLSMQTYGMLLFTDLKWNGYESDRKVLFPGFFMNYRKGSTAFGLGVYIPYGGGKFKYEGINPAKMGLDPIVGNVSIEQQLGLVAFGGAMAIKLADNFSIGIALNGYAGMYDYTVNSANAGILKKDDLSGVAAVGGSVSVMYKPSRTLSIGVTAKLPVRIRVEGTSVTNVGTSEVTSSAYLRMPWYFTAGVAFQPNRELTITFDVNYAPYSTMETFTFTRGSLVDDTFESGYKDAFYFALGASYQLNRALQLRGGVVLTPNATETDKLLPSNDVTHIQYSVGAGWEFVPGVVWSASLHYLMGFERENGSVIHDKDVLMVMTGFDLKL